MLQKVDQMLDTILSVRSWPTKKTLGTILFVFLSGLWYYIYIYLINSHLIAFVCAKKHIRNNK